MIYNEVRNVNWLQKNKLHIWGFLFIYAHYFRYFIQICSMNAIKYLQYMLWKYWEGQRKSSFLKCRYLN